MENKKYAVIINVNNREVKYAHDDYYQWADACNLLETAVLYECESCAHKNINIENQSLKTEKPFIVKVECTDVENNIMKRIEDRWASTLEEVYGSKLEK